MNEYFVWDSEGDQQSLIADSYDHWRRVTDEQILEEIERISEWPYNHR